ncbi:hypothetical protein KNO15_00105 [Leifsonia shinshuensis]|uniref:hypothetical protein n=1 Tax=Leifsonia shinshuensis TaxID=150026 RepID=UPI001F50EF5F|nr:hypothetical protein [Leifsonia shinshuensis]MCI0155104.1 hypothetical protein [Leifsonia shinshuensis]
MRARVLTRWVAYYAFALLWLIFLAFMMIQRIRTSSLGSSTELTIAIVVLGGAFLAAAVGFPLWVLPNVRCRAELRRRFPEAVVLVARRDDFRPFIDVDALDIPYRRIPYFLTVVAARDSLAAWAGGDPGEQPRELASIPWLLLAPFEQAATEGALPQFVLRSTAQWNGEEQPLQLTLGSNAFGGLFPQTYGSSRAALAALNARAGWLEDELPQT